MYLAGREPIYLQATVRGRVNQMFRIAVLLLCSLIAAALLGAPAAAGIADVPRGGTVFVGEQGLNITATGIVPGGQIARFGSGGNVQTDAPSDMVVISDPASFYVVPGTFASATGAWYTWPGRELAFIVKDPTLQVRVINTRTGREPGTNVVSGDPLGFRIETNLYAIAQRPGVSGAPVTIHVRDPTGAEFTSLVGPEGTTVSLVDIPVNTSVHETGPVWDTDTKHYRAGTYEVWADCNANRIRDNYDEVGKTTTHSRAESVQVGESQGPSITGAATPKPTASATVSATTAPAETVTGGTAATTPTGTGTANLTGMPTGPVTTAVLPTTTQSPGFGTLSIALLALAGLGLLLFRRG